MTQINASLPAGLTPEQMQAVIAYIMQNQPAATAPPASGENPSGASTVSGSTTASSVEEDVVMSDAPAEGCPPTPVKTPPRRNTKNPPPATPRATPNKSMKPSDLPSSAAGTPSSKMAQLTLEGRKLSATPTAVGKRGTKSSPSVRKGPVPTGHDPNLVYEEPDGDAQAGSDPFEGFPAVVTLPDVKQEDSKKGKDSTPKASANRRGRYEPTGPMWMRLRRARDDSESSPPPVETSPKKRARVVSPQLSPVPSPSFSRKKAAEGTIASPFESPNNVNAAAVATLERLLERARQGAEIPQLQALLEQESPTTKSRDSSKFVDDEAEDAEGDDDEDENGNLEGFVVNDDVVEYDNDAPALPDDDDDEDEREEAGQLGEGGDDGERSDDDVPLSRSSSRLRRRRRADDDDESSDIEIVPTVATPTPSAKKGKGRAVQGPNRVDKNKDRDENPEARVDSTSDRSDQPPTTSGKGKGRAGQPTTRVEKGKGRADQAVARSNKGKGRANDTGSRKGDGPSTSSADRAHGEGAVKPQSTRTSSSPVPNDFSWQTSSPTLSECARGLHPGSTALDGTHGVLEPLTVAPGDPVLTWQDFVTGFLDAYGFYSNARTMLGGCAFTLSDLQDNGWEYPSVETVAAAETHVNVRNLLRGLLFRRRGPYINDSQVELQDVVAVTVSQPTASAQRHKLAIKSTMAPAVSITGGVIRFWKIDSPTSGNLPIRYVIMSPYEGLFDHAVAFDCMAFGQENLYCMAFKNGIRYSTLPDWGNSRGGASAAPASPGKGITSSSIRRGGNASLSRRTPKFELGANDNVTVLDARKVTLPDDISTWPTVLPTFEDPLPKNAVAFVAHTTSVWVGNRSASGVTHNIQFNLVYIVIIGALPDGFV